MNTILHNAIVEWSALLPEVELLALRLQQLGQRMLDCWSRRGKVLVAGNGGSAADAMHLAEELVVRYRKNRRALAAIALLDPTVLTCCGNDFGYEPVFTRQIEALGNPGDVFVGFTTSGNSPNLLAAFRKAKELGLTTAAFLGRDGGQSRGLCDFEFVVPSPNTARVQEAHQLLYHTLCEWIDSQVD